MRAEDLGTFQLDLKKPVILVAQHPVTEEFEDAATQMTETLEAVCGMDLQTVLIFPNNDAGSGQTQRLIEQHERVPADRQLPDPGCNRAGARFDRNHDRVAVACRGLNR